MTAAAPVLWGCDPSTARRLLWIRANRQPGESLYAAGQRYLSDHRGRSTDAMRDAARTVRRKPCDRAHLIDDGEEDSMWMLDHSARRYRVRPWRLEDGEPVGYTFPCITVIDLDTMTIVQGVPQSVLRMVGVPADPIDSDLFGALFFAVRKASAGFYWRRKAPAGLFG